MCPPFMNRGRRKDFRSGPAIIGVRNFYNKLPKEWPGQNQTSRTGSYACVNACNHLGISDAEAMTCLEIAIESWLKPIAVGSEEDWF